MMGELYFRDLRENIQNQLVNSLKISQQVTEGFKKKILKAIKDGEDVEVGDYHKVDLFRVV